MIALQKAREQKIISTAVSITPKIKVFVLDNPGWSQWMVLRSIQEVLNNIEVELEEQWTDKSMMLEANTFTISVKEMLLSEYEALEEWDG